jgi:vanillate O-demethylase ferredoxin subunit
MDGIDVVVVEKRIEAQDIASFVLARPDGQPLPPFEAGAHIDVEAGPGLVRQYSLCGDPQDCSRYLIGVLREVASRGGSLALHDRIQAGDRLRIGAPRNLFALAPAPHSLLVAGGIGITPMLAMAEVLARAGASFALHYCARSAQRVAFRDRIGQAAWAGRMRLHLDDGAAGQRLDLERELARTPPGTRLYVCGPAGFMDWVTGSAARAGWPTSHLHLERFGASAPAGEDSAFEVVVASSGARYRVPAGRSVAAVLSEQGVFVPVSCEQGICGTCLTRVLDGVPDHRDTYLTEEEQAANDIFTPCCSRARSGTLVLDL